MTTGWRFGFAAILAGGLAAATPAAAQQVVVYTSNDSVLNDLVFAHFKQTTGITVQPVTAGSGVIWKRVESERARPQGDIIWGVSRSLLQTNKQYLAPYKGKDFEAVPAEYRDPDGLWLGTNLHVLAILQNTKLVPGDTGPKSWADLLDPKWKGKIAFTDPANSGTAYANATVLVDLWGGGDAGWTRVEQLFRNIKVLSRSSLVFQGVGNGEYSLGMSFENPGFVWEKNGAPIKVVYPADGTVVSMEGVGVIKGGPNTEAAKVFVDYVSRKDIREMILKETFRRPARQDIDLAQFAPNMKPLKDIKVIDYDEVRWTEARTPTADRIRGILERSR